MVKFGCDYIQLHYITLNIDEAKLSYATATSLMPNCILADSRRQDHLRMSTTQIYVRVFLCVLTQEFLIMSSVIFCATWIPFCLKFIDNFFF
jgi:hypothetical protein